jgi:dTDP-4-amino-4,6-dideoxygalactose transaminase
VGGLEVGYVTDALRSGRHAGDGPFTAKVKAFIEQALPAEAVLLTTSCTSALELAAILLRPPGEVQPEVLLPTFTFVSTANAFLLHGWRPVFCDVDPTTGNVTPETLAARITPRTRAICPVHYAGVPADMEGIMALAAQHGLRVVEDAAQAFYAKDRGRSAGTIGDLGAFSFHETKNIGCGEGGALVVNAADLHERARIVREKGTNRSQWLDGHVDKYTWMDVGSSFLSSDVLAAMLLAQLERYPELGAPRRHPRVVALRRAPGPAGRARATALAGPPGPRRAQRAHLLRPRDGRPGRAVGADQGAQRPGHRCGVPLPRAAHHPAGAACPRRNPLAPGLRAVR